MALHPTRGARRPPRTRPEGHVRRHGGERRILRRVRSVRRVRGGCRTRRPRIGPFEFVSLDVVRGSPRARPAPGHSRVRQEARASREIPQRSFHGGFVRQGYGRWGDGARGCIRHGDDRGRCTPRAAERRNRFGGGRRRRRGPIFADPRDAVGPGGYKRRREHDGAFSNNRAVRAMGVYLRDMAEATTEDEEVKLGRASRFGRAMRELAERES